MKKINKTESLFKICTPVKEVGLKNLSNNFYIVELEIVSHDVKFENIINSIENHLNSLPNINDEIDIKYLIFPQHFSNDCVHKSEISFSISINKETLKNKEVINKFMEDISDIIFEK